MPIATGSCGTAFNIPVLRCVYEAVWEVELAPRNLQRKVLSADGFVEEAGDVIRGRGRRAKVYRAGGAATLQPPILQR